MCRCVFVEDNAGVGTKDRPLFNSSSSSWENVTLLKLCTVKVVVGAWGGAWIKKRILFALFFWLWGLSWALSLVVFSCGE